MHHEKFMKTKKLLVFKHDALTPPLISRLGEPEPLPLDRQSDEAEAPSGTPESADPTGPKPHAGVIRAEYWWLAL